TRPTDISLSETVEIQKKVDRIIQRFPEVKKVFTKMGSAESNVDPNGLNLSDTFLILEKDHSKWPVQSNGQPRTKEELVSAVCDAIQNVAESEECTPEEPIGGRFNDMLQGSRADVALRIFGPDLDKLTELTAKAREIMGSIRGVDEVQEDHLMTPRPGTVIEFRPDKQKLDSVDLHVNDVEQALETAMVGQNVGYYYEQDLRFPIVLRIASPARDSRAGIESTPIELPGGGTIALGKLGHLENTTEVITIGRNNGRRFASAGVFLKDRDLQSFVDEARQKIDAGLKLPPGFHLEWGGQFKNLDRARIKLATILPITLGLIFLILFRTFGSAKQAFLVLLCIPFGLTGSIFALYVRGISFSISAEIGCIALAGIAVLNGTVLVSFFNQLREEGHSVLEAVERGALTRLRPVLMTALVAGIGFLPMALNTGTGAEVQRPLATVVIGGLVTATFLTLLVLPSLYLWMEDRN
ncbi:MAG: efflux RND transporter permease subunit, partial [Leptospiraceae bacterium]|nr:efflux RND transporter permease subunit [Leptospiraceae bacterium]